MKLSNHRTGVHATLEADSRTGSVLVTVIIFVLVLAGLGSSMVRVDLSISNSRRTEGAAQLAYFAAEAGIDEAFILLRSRLIEPEEGDSVSVGTEQIPRVLASSRYWAEVTRLDAWRYQVVATGTCQGERKRQECVFSTAPVGFFQYAAFGKDGLLVGEGCATNSYDPTLGTFASQAARGNGGVGSNGSVVLGADTFINGDAVTGENGSIVENGSNVVITGDRESLGENITFPPIEPPIVSSSGPLEVTEDATLGPGLLGFDGVSASAGSTLTIEGPAQIVMSDFVLGGGGSLVIDSSNGPVEIYSSGDWDISGDSTVRTTSESARDFQVFISGDTDSGTDPATVSLNANTVLHGAIYAPDASITLPAGFELFGSLIARSLNFGDDARLHFDESLLYESDEETLALETLIWRPISADLDPTPGTPGP
ncbi:MAG: pilus assembly PilX N-terminal domain-containing protein [Planctomycetota bacterium]|jgi:hypothetical protein